MGYCAVLHGKKSDLGIKRLNPLESRGVHIFETLAERGAKGSIRGAKSDTDIFKNANLFRGWIRSYVQQIVGHVGRRKLTVLSQTQIMGFGYDSKFQHVFGDRAILLTFFGGAPLRFGWGRCLPVAAGRKAPRPRRRFPFWGCRKRWYLLSESRRERKTERRNRRPLCRG